MIRLAQYVTGDTPTRRASFDALVCGCIPVLLSDNAAGLWYPLHLNTSDVALLVDHLRSVSAWWREAPSSLEFARGIVARQHASMIDRILDTIRRRGPAATKQQQKRVISLIPKLVYSATGATRTTGTTSRESTSPMQEDALTVVLRQIRKRIITRSLS